MRRCSGTVSVERPVAHECSREHVTRRGVCARRIDSESFLT